MYMSPALRTALRRSTVGARGCTPLPAVLRHVPRARFRSVATTASSEPPVTATNRVEATLKRFWKDVGIEERSFPGSSAAVGERGYVVTLDKRPLKTPSGNVLTIPKDRRLVATLIAMEWENQETMLKPHSLPMTSLASRAIDAFQDETLHSQVRAQLLKYLETDTICFHQTEPQAVATLQQQHWLPLLDWVRSTYDLKINTSTSLLLPPHPPETFKTLDGLMEKFDPWQMASMERAVYTSKSFLIALALVQRHITIEEAALASHVEVNSQIQKWGEVEDSHDVDFHDIRRQLGSVACLLAKQ